MSIDPELLRMLRDRAGLRTQSLEAESGEALIRRRMQAVGIESAERYRMLVDVDPEELEALVAAVAVPETWYFRYPSSCEWLVRWLRERRRAAEAGGRLRMLSAPCATGQEPITMAVCAAEAGWPLDSIEVHALDASGKAISIALRAVEQPLPLRDPLPEWAHAWFEHREGGVVPQSNLFSRIRFEHADLRTWRAELQTPFDVVACRNLLIYLEPDARRQVIANCERRLAEDGVLLLGHADHDRELLDGFEPVGVAQTFAHRRRRPGGVPRRSDNPPGVAIRDRSPVEVETDAASGDHRGRSKVSPPNPESFVARATRRDVVGAEATPDVPAVAPPTAWIEASRARVLADAGRLEEAERSCRDRLSEQPTDQAAIELLGCIRLAAGDAEEAGEWFRRLVYLVPDHADGLLHLASLAERTGDVEQASRLRERARRASEATSVRPHAAEGKATHGR